MATSWKSQQGNGEYRLQFETDNEEKYKLVEKAAQMAMDGKAKADFAEVVRCKDCIHARQVKHRGEVVEWSYRCSYLKPNTNMWDVDYCRYGERKTDDAL